MKEIASSILVLASVLMLISAKHFDSLLFWGIGTIMLVDGFILLITFTLFPEKLSQWLENTSSSTASYTRAKQ